MNDNAIVQMMMDKTKIAGTIVQKISSIEDAVQYTMNLCKEKGFSTIASPGLHKTHHSLLSNQCESENYTLLDSPLRDHASSIDISLTWAEYGIAETGTIMVVSDSEEIRIATMLSQIHVAILPITKIRTDTAGIEPELDTLLKLDSPSYTAFITGPSRTADIERVLAIGVHGPVELHLLLIEGDIDHD